MPSIAMMLRAASVAGGGGTPASRLLSIVGSKLWCELPIGGGWFTDAGVTPATTTGDSIYQWSDVSGHNRHAVQTLSVGRRPTLDTATTHLSLPTVQFFQIESEAAVQRLVLPNMSALTEAEIVYVIKVDSDPPGAETMTGLDWFGPSGVANTHFPYTDSNVYDSFGTDSRKTIGNPSPSLSSQFRVYDRYSKASDWRCWLDNSSLFTTGSNTVAFNTAPTIGCGELTSYKTKSRIAGVAIFTPVLDSTERGNVYTALTT